MISGRAFLLRGTGTYEDHATTIEREAFSELNCSDDWRGDSISGMCIVNIN